MRFGVEEVAQLLGTTAGQLKRRLSTETFGWKAQREAAELVPTEMSLAELIRAGALRHFTNSGARPDGRTRYFLNSQRFDLRPFVIVLRSNGTVYSIGRDEGLKAAAQPETRAVYDPTELLAALGMSWTE